jgi:pimeloyl-ACP methyl ester carboxylesterase
LNIGLTGTDPISVRVTLNEAAEVDLAEVVVRLAGASQVKVEPPSPLTLPMTGRSAPLTRRLLTETLGPMATLKPQAREIIFELDPEILEGDGKADWERRLRDLAERSTRESARRARYGMSHRPSYQANDPSRPTVCLIHGLNSTSNVFKHMFAPLEQAGYGIVTYDFPYNRDLDTSSAAFRRDWLAFRKASGDAVPWAIVAHSMGSLLARSYIEDDSSFARDVASLIMVAPPNQGSSLAQGQTFLQMVQGLQALGGSSQNDPLALLGDGLGAAADDMTPGSDYLKTLNARPRRQGIAYHTIAGDRAYLSAAARKRVEVQIRATGLLGGLGRVVATSTSASLDEITDGLGDGCVSVASTRLAGVTDHRTLHANHLELIRAPLFYPDPGPVASMPALHEMLRVDLPVPSARR